MQSQLVKLHGSLYIQIPVYTDVLIVHFTVAMYICSYQKENKFVCFCTLTHKFIVKLEHIVIV